MTAELIIGILLAIFAIIFLTSLVMYFTGSRHFNKKVMVVSTVVLLVLMAALVIALKIDGTLFKDVEPKMFLK